MPDTSDTFTAALADRYRIERELGRGGMATVYLAHDLRHDRPVALKVLRPELAASLGPERFLQEIRIAARLKHPHILPVLALRSDAEPSVRPSVDSVRAELTKLVGKQQRCRGGQHARETRGDGRCARVGCELL